MRRLDKRAFGTVCSLLAILIPQSRLEADAIESFAFSLNDNIVHHRSPSPTVLSVSDTSGSFRNPQSVESSTQHSNYGDFGSHTKANPEIFTKEHKQEFFAEYTNDNIPPEEKAYVRCVMIAQEKARMSNPPKYIPSVLVTLCAHEKDEMIRLLGLDNTTLITGGIDILLTLVDVRRTAGTLILRDIDQW